MPNENELSAEELVRFTNQGGQVNPDPREEDQSIDKRIAQETKPAHRLESGDEGEMHFEPRGQIQRSGAGQYSDEKENQVQLTPQRGRDQRVEQDLDAHGLHKAGTGRHPKQFFHLEDVDPADEVDSDKLHEP